MLRETKTVIRTWARERLSLRMQAVLMAAIRGCDSADKNDPTKAIVWALRWEILNPAVPEYDPYVTTTFMGYKPELTTDRRRFLGSFDHYPVHFILHLAHAAEILGYCHPLKSVRDYWHSFYVELVTQMHLNIETHSELVIRLSDTPDEKTHAIYYCPEYGCLREKDHEGGCLFVVETAHA